MRCGCPLPGKNVVGSWRFENEAEGVLHLDSDRLHAGNCWLAYYEGENFVRPQAAHVNGGVVDGTL